MIRDTADMFEQPERGRFGENEEQRWPGRVTGASDLHDFTLTLRQERPLSIAVSDPSKPGAPWIWLPKSHIEMERKGGAVVVVTVPEWLAVNKGLL